MHPPLYKEVSFKFNSGHCTTLHYKSEFFKLSWNSRSYIFVLSCRFTLKKKKRITNDAGYPRRHVHPTWISVKFRFAFKLIPSSSDSNDPLKVATPPKITSIFCGR